MATTTHPKEDNAVKGSYWMMIGALLAGSGVALGAYHAHGMQAWLEAQPLAADEVSHRLENAATAVRYQMYHAVGLMIIGLSLHRATSKLLQAAGWLLLLGTLLFSGGLLLFVFTGTFLHWSIVPSGGLLLIVGWVTAAIGFVRSNVQRATA
jgi:uncharacterized membrane protein YgdD (TMEM256/DUF423 family)